MRWVKDKPKCAGIYFRTTLWGRPVRQDVFEIPGVDGLFTMSGDGSSKIPIDKYDPHMFWFGPIPGPPLEADYCKRLADRKE